MLVRRTPVTLLTSLIMVVASAATSGTIGSAASASPFIAGDTSPLAPTGTGLVHKWVALNQVRAESLTPAQVAAVANNFDLAVVKDSQAALVDQLKAANPRLIALVYHNGAFAQKNEATKFPAEWYAYDANRNKIIQTVWGNYLMDVSNPNWVNYVVGACRSAKVRSHADGCYTDMMMTAPLYPDYCTGRPVNPATGKVWTFPAFQDAVEHIAARIRAEVSGPSAANGVMSGNGWFADGGRSTKTLTNNTDGSHSEIWLRNRKMSPTDFPGVTSWKRDVDMVAQAEAENRQLMVETKLWERNGYQVTAEMVDRWRAFTLATFLLGTQGKSWFLFTPDRTMAGMMAAHPWEQVAVGSPIAPYSQLDGVYKRSFLNGFAAVNPAGTASAVALPPGTWLSLTGQVQSGRIAMAGHTGMVWTRVVATGPGATAD